MFEGLFGDGEEGLDLAGAVDWADGADGSATTSASALTQAQRARAARCKNVVRPRGETGFVGLANQGATCYLNSLLQCLYMTPEFRKGLYALTPDELEVDPADVRDDVVLDVPPETPQAQAQAPTAEKPPRTGRVVPFELARLFAFMEFADVGYVSTRALTRSFGWEGGQAVQQQDVQELNRLLFEEIEASLLGTPQQDLIAALYKGTMTSQIVCSECRTVKQRPEPFQDVVCAVRGFCSLQDSLRAAVTFDVLDGDNQYMCETCGRKVDARKGMVFAQLPPVLVFSLSRFDYDWEHDQRVKITTKFAFPFELDMEPYTKEASSSSSSTPPSSSSSSSSTTTGADDMLYELFFVVIHRGGAYGGHYHSLIKHGGVWYDFNDGNVGAVTEEDVQRTFGGKAQCAYMVGYRKKRFPAIGEHQRQADAPPAAVMAEVASVQKRIDAARAENDRIAHELQLLVTTDAYWAAAPVGEDQAAWQLSQSGAEAASTPVTVDSRSSLAELVRLAAEKLGAGRLDPAALRHLCVMDTSAAPANVRVAASASLATAQEREAPLASVAGLDTGCTVLLSAGSIAGYDARWGPAVPTPITLRIKYNDAGSGALLEQCVAVPEGATAEDSPMLLAVVEQAAQLLRVAADRVVFEHHGKEVDICSTLAALGLKHMSVLRVRAAAPPSPPPEAAAAEGGEEAAAEEPLPEDAITVYASLAYTSTAMPSVSVRVSPRATVAQLKAAVIRSIAENRPEAFTVRLALGGRLLEDESVALGEARVKDDDRVTLCPAPSAAAARRSAASSEQAEQQAIVLSFVTDGGDTLEVPVQRSSTLAECKQLLCALLPGAEPAQIRVKRADQFGQPREYLNRPERTVEQYHLHDGDKLWAELGPPAAPGSVLCSVYRVAEAVPQPEVPLSWSIAALGDCSPLLYTHLADDAVHEQPPNCQPLPAAVLVDAADTRAVLDLRAAVFGALVAAGVAAARPEQLRLWHAGRLLKDDSAMLAALRLADKPTLFVQVLPEPDPLLNRHGALLCFCHHLASTRVAYDPAEEVVLEQPTVGELLQCAAAQYDIPPERVRLAVYKPTTMTWRPLALPTVAAPAPAEPVEAQPQQQQQQQQQQKKKGGAAVTMETLLTQKPFNVHDGDSLCVMDVSKVPYPHVSLAPLLKLFGNKCDDGVPVPSGRARGAGEDGEVEERNGKTRRKRRAAERPEAKLVIQGFARRLLDERHAQLEQEQQVQKEQ